MRDPPTFGDGAVALALQLARGEVVEKHAARRIGQHNLDTGLDRLEVLAGACQCAARASGACECIDLAVWKEGRVRVAAGTVVARGSDITCLHHNLGAGGVDVGLAVGGVVKLGRGTKNERGEEWNGGRGGRG